jgi:2-desacetyl-2-hydroxyethyl bacteriochlorophyllide A dehydrogenase
VSQPEYAAAVIERPGTPVITRARARQPGSNEIRVRLEGTGVCASNLPVWQGREWFRYPMAPGAPGHEGWGEIDQVGDEVTDFAPGDRVAFVSGHAYAEIDIAQANAAVRLPPALDRQVFPGEPLGCAMNIFERADIQHGQHVAIVGTGFLGLLLTQLANRAGAQVLGISRREDALQRALGCGAADTLRIGPGEDTAGQALERTAGRGFERVIEVAGEQATLDLASQLVAERGRLIIAGYHQDGRRVVDMQSWNWRGIDVINAHERSVERYAAGMRAAVAAVCEGRLDPYPLFTHRVPLAGLGAAFELMATRPPGFVKALVTCGQTA